MLKQFFKSFSLAILAAVLIAQPTFAVIPDESTLDYFDNNDIFYYNPVGHHGEGCGSSSATKLAGANLKEKIWNYFIDAGFDDAQTAGIVGNGLAESGLTPTRSANGSYWGIFQWGPRRPELWALMDEAGLGQYTSSEYWAAGSEEKIPEADLDAIIKLELDYLMSPVDNSWIEKIKEANSPEMAAEIFLVTFERAINGDDPITLYGPFMGLLYQGTTARRDFAREVYDEYSGHGVSSSSVSQSEDGQNLTIIGDSITVGAHDALINKFSYLTDSQIDARVSRPWAEGLSVAQSMSLNDVVVFALGTNNSSPAINQSDIDQLLAITGDRVVVLVTNYGVADYSANNELFRNLAKENSNIIVADWEAEVSKDPSKYLSGDNIHPNAEGTELFAQLIYDAINGAYHNGCSVGSEFSDLVLAYAWPEYHPAPFVDRKPAYAEAVETSLAEGRYVGGFARGVRGIDCGGFVTILVQNSGLEPEYNSDPAGATSRQEQWVQEHNWTLLNSAPGTPVDTSLLQAGDVAFSSGHTFIYVGEIPGFESNIASASIGESSARAPMAGTESLISGNGAIVRWYRNPNYNPGAGGKSTLGGLVAE